MTVASNSSASLARTTNLPSSTTGWTVRFWLRQSAAPAAYGSVFCLDDGGGNYFEFETDSTTTPLSLYWSGGGSGSQLIVDPGTSWYFFAIVQTSSTASTVYYRSSTATALTSVACGGVDTAAINGMRFMQSGFGELLSNGEAIGFALWNAQLTAAELLEESYRIRPRRKANLDSHLPMISTANVGRDLGGLGRDWTVTGTFAAAATQPPISTGGGRIIQLTATAAAPPATSLPLRSGGARNLRANGIYRV